MDLILNDDQRLLQEALAKLGASKGGARKARELRQAGSDVDEDTWHELLKADWPSALVSEENNGLGLGAFDLAIALEEAGKHILMTPLVESVVAAWAVSTAKFRLKLDGQLIVPAIAILGRDFRKDEESKDAPQLDLLTSKLSGRVEAVPFGLSANALVVSARSATAALLCLVPRAAKGVSIEARRHIDGSVSGSVSFDNVLISEDEICADGADDIIEKMQELLVLGTSAELLGVTQAALEMTIAYIRQREQFGNVIGSFQAIQHRVADCYVDAELNRSLLFKVLASWDAGTSQPAMVAATKARIARCALKTVRLALQLHGAIGYTAEHDIGIYYRRAVALSAKYGNELTHVDRFLELTQCGA